MKKEHESDFSKFLDVSKMSRKEALIGECEKQGIAIYVDDASETSSGIYAELRAVASEAELERRLNASKSVRFSYIANLIALAALVISIIALVKSFK